MKKMNFYFNFGRCRTLILPALMFLLGTMAFAGNSSNIPFLPGFKSVSIADLGKTSENFAVLSKKFNVKSSSAFATTLALATANATTCGGNGSITPTVTTTVATPFTAKVTYFNQALVVVATQTLTNSVAFGAQALPVGTYTARVTIEDPVGSVLEFASAGPVTINGPVDATAPSVTNNAAVSLNAGAACAVQLTSTPTGPSTSVSTNVGVSFSEDCSNIIAVAFDEVTAAGVLITANVTSVTGPGPKYVKVRATSAGGTTTSATTTITIVDNTPPVLAGCADITINAACGVATTLTWPVPTATDNCSGAPVVAQTTSTTTVPGTRTRGTTLVANTGGDVTFPVRYTATDAAGNVSSCTFNVTVATPAITGGVFASTTLPIPTCASTTTLTYTIAAPTGGCAPITLTAQSGPASGTSVGPGTYTISRTYRDAAGKVLVYNNNIVVVDPPACNGNAAGLAGMNAPCSNLNGGSVTATVTSIKDALISPYQIRISIFNSSNVLVGSFLDPTVYANGAAFTGPLTYTVPNLPAGTYRARITMESPAGTVIDYFDMSDVAPAGIPITTTITTDPDVIAPVFSGTCPATFAAATTATTCNFTPAVTAGQGTTSVTTNIGKIITDACSNTTVTFSPSGAINPGVATAVTVTATDAAGNVSTCIVTVTVTDQTAPTFTTCPPSATVTIPACSTTAAVTYGVPVVSDNCTPVGSIQIADLGIASGSVLPAGAYNVVWTATDLAGNSSSCSATYTVVQTPSTPIVCGAITNSTAPIATCATTTTLNYTIAAPTGGCGALTLVNSSGLASGTTVTAGTYTIVQVYRDASGVEKTCSYEIVVAPAPADVTPPVLAGCVAPAPVTEGACGTPAVITYANPTATDNCTTVPVTITRTGPASGSALTAGTYKVLFTATDAAGNSSSCSIDVVVNKFVDNVAPVLTACPANQTYSVACGSRANIVYTAPTATDNCPTSPVRVTQTGPVSGSLLDAGVYPVVFTAIDAAGNSTTCSFTITVTNPAPTNLACIGGSATSPGANITLDANCSMVIRPNHVLLSCIGDERDYDVVVTTTGGTVLPNATVGIGQVGKVLRVAVTYRPTGVSCWGFVKIEDKTAPTIVCPVNVTLPCDKADDANNLAIVGELSGPNSTVAALNQVSAANATAPGANDGRVQECSKWTQFWSDVKTGSVCTGFTITRTWWAKDEWGNQSSTCTQIITIAAPAQVTPVLRDVTLACADVDAAAKAALFTDVVYRPTGGASCGLSFELASTREIALCPGSYKILRQWNAVNMCAANMVTPLPTQTIIVTNTATPTVTANYDNYTRQEDGTYCWLMNGTMQMTSTKYKTAINNVTTTFNAGTTTISPLASSTMCGAANIRVQLAGTDNGCAPGALTYSVDDSRVQISASGLITNKPGQPFMKNANGTNPSFTVTATNACGSLVRHTFVVNLEDNMTPNTVCKVFTTATLDENGFVRVPLSAFENGSSDNCGIERQMVRRMTKSNNDACGVQGQVAETACWNDYVDFTCADLGDKDPDGGQLQVVLRTVDAAGNVSDCMVRIDLVDKTAPTCTNQPEISYICTDVRLSSYKGLFTRPAAFDNCGIVKVDSSDNRELVLACGKGDVTRSWTFTDCGGAKTTCTQKLVVTPVYGFTVPKLADEQKACALGSNDIVTIMDNDRRSILASASLTTFAGTKTCSAPIVETEYWKYSSSQFCQIYRIRYTIIDKCAPFYGYTIGTPGTCNVMRSGDGTRQWGTPNATCTQVESVVGATVNGEQQHIVIYERYIYVNDVTPPTTTLPVAPDPCTTYTGAATGGGSQVTNIGCGFNYYTKLTGKDDCGTGTAASDPSTVTFMWRVVNKATGAQFATGTTADVYLANLAFGKYTICYRVTDLCGNMSQEYCYDIEGKDCKAPQILVHNKVLELAGRTGVRSTGMADLLYIDIRNNVFDNCDGDLTNSSKITLEKGGLTSATRPTAAVGTQSLRFTCDDLYASGGTATTSKVVEVRVWAIDAAGNWNYVVTPITVQDNIGICNNTFTVVVSGSALTEGNAAVANVAVSASVNGAVVATTDAVNSTFNLGVAPATNVQVRAAKTNNDDAATGVTTFDIAKVSQHVLDIEKLATPYKLIAADVDKSGVIDALDMLHMRRFILKITPSLPGGNFRFVDKAYAFRNPSDPFGEDFPEVVNIASLTSNTSANFVAVKLGDVNDSYAGTTVRGSRSLTLNANDMNVVAGNEYTVNISADKMDAAAFQGTFSFNGATVKSVKAGNLANMTDGNFGIFANAVTTSWNGKTQDAADVMTITFVANKSGKLSDMLTVNSALTQSVANDAAGNEMNVNLKFNTGKVAGGEFALYQNQPNPVAGETTIGFNLPKDGAARLTVTSVDGKVVKVINGEYKAGYNVVTINKSDIQASGVFYYRLETADHSASKKMVIME